MVNDLKDLMRQNLAAPPPDHLDLDALVGAGRRRVRQRQTSLVGAASVLAVGAVASTILAWPQDGGAGAVTGPPTPDAPVLRLSDAERAMPGRDYRVLASHTNPDLEVDNGQYFDGVTDDGKVLFRDGPRMDQSHPRFALLDTATGEKDWLPDLAVGGSQTWPVALGADRLVLISQDPAGGDGLRSRLVSHVFDRATRQWTSTTYPDLPLVDGPGAVLLAPDGRLYVRVPATRGAIPKGGWPVGPDGEADDADAEGDTFGLWSVSLTDGTDVRDENRTVGGLAFTDEAMVWTDSSNGAAGMVHVRDLSTGKEHSFDPRMGERCNLLSFTAAEDRIVMSQYCGTYEGGVRDDRVQVLSTEGDQVVTLQDSGVEGVLAGTGGSAVITVTAYRPKGGGTYVYDLATDRFLRLSESVSSWGMGGPTRGGAFLWHTAVNDGKGAKQWLGELVVR